MEVQVPDQDRMLDIVAAADQLGHVESFLRRIVDRTKQGKLGPQIRFFQVGKGRIMFKQEWIDEFIAENSIEPGQVVPVKKPKRGRQPTPANHARIEPHWSLAV